MGNAVIREAASKGFEIVGSIDAPGLPLIGKSLRELGISDSETRIMSPEHISEAAEKADIYISFTTPTAETENIPIVAGLGKKIVLGTTGFTNEQDRVIREAMQGKVPAVFSPNFSVGVNMLFKLAQMLKAFPPDYSFSISEIPHTAKKDAPSGTAKKLGEIIAAERGYSKTVYGREGISPRMSDELEIAALRAGGVPGIHDLIVAGPHEMLRLEHTAFSRSVFAQGAVYAAQWLNTQTEPRIFTMEDVLGSP
jgi:4-hydroxy-tetrahydrodipicolinate reductase